MVVLVLWDGLDLSILDYLSSYGYVYLSRDFDNFHNEHITKLSPLTIGFRGPASQLLGKHWMHS